MTGAVSAGAHAVVIYLCQAHSVSPMYFEELRRIMTYWRTKAHFKMFAWEYEEPTTVL